MFYKWQYVALRKESVDRNSSGLPVFLLGHCRSLSARRAWIEIRVGYKFADLVTSLSARRAWIEIKYVVKDSDFSGSLSARRAWIEICGGAFGRLSALSSLSARRAWIEIRISRLPRHATVSRSPQGERG